MSQRKWTIFFEDDGPSFVSDGHEVIAFPELGRVEVVPASELQGAVEACRRWREWLDRAPKSDDPEPWHKFAVAMDLLCHDVLDE